MSVIPKTLHYCWFGDGPMSGIERRCMKSWSCILPDWEIIRWDESNFDVNACSFSKDAYEAGKWAFVSDYARFRILHEYGGVFLDTDVELLRPLDELCDRKAFVGFMQNRIFVNPGLVLASESRGRVLEEVIKRYENMKFAVGKGRNSMPTSPRVMTAALEECYGLVCDGSYQELEGITVFPSECFDSLDSHTGELSITSQTYSIHHYSGTWLSPAKKYRVETRKKLAPKVGPKLSWFLSSAASVVKYGRDAF